MTRPTGRWTGATGALHVLVLANFAVAQPLLDLLARHPEFFAVRRSEPIDVVLLALLLTVGLPGLLAWATAAAGLIAPHVGRAVRDALVGGLSGAVAMQALGRVEVLSGAVVLPAAAAIGLAATASYRRLPPVRTMLTTLAPAPLVFAGLFLFGSSVLRAPRGGDGRPPALPAVEADTPVVLVVLDELNGTWLMDASRRIDAVRYPNLAALAGEAVWYRNATTVSDDTVQAVPAILTGRRPDPARRLPTAADHPDNLFTLLGGSYDLVVLESVTHLCPEVLCRERVKDPLAARMRTLLLDLEVVYAHILLTPDLAAGLPAVSGAWQGFATSDGEAAAPKGIGPRMRGRPALVRDFLASIQATPRPTLYFLHVLLPHAPWRYLPSGRAYDGIGAAGRLEGRRPDADAWGVDDWLVIQAFQRYLLQVGFVDTLIGELVARLEAVGLYDRALVVVTADHGIGFRPGDGRRPVTPTNLVDIMPVPLLVKLPGDRTGAIDDRNVETIDILPTIADVLGIDIPWSVDGRSMLDRSHPERPEKAIVAAASGARLTAGSRLEARDLSLEWMLALFGDGAKPHGLFAIGPYGHLVGRRVRELPVAPAARLEVELEQAEALDDVDPVSGWMPARVTGRLLEVDGRQGLAHVAVAVNGTVGAVTRVSVSRDGEARFSAMVPEALLVPGRNQVEVLVVSGRSERPSLTRVRERRHAGYVLEASAPDGRWRLLAADGTSVPVEPGAVTGWVDAAVATDADATLAGWAVDPRVGRPAAAVLVFVGGEQRYGGRPNRDRPDVAGRYANPALLTSGFSIDLPPSLLGEQAGGGVRVFAVSSEGVASELAYPANYPWRGAR